MSKEQKNIIDHGYSILEILEKHGTNLQLKQDCDRIIANKEIIDEVSAELDKPVNEVIIKAAQENVEIELEVVYENGETFKFAKF